MTAIILGWNPARWNDWNYAEVIERVATTGLHLERWSVGSRRNIAAGTDAWLLLQGERCHGLIGHGVVLSAQPEPGPHHAGPDTGPDPAGPDPAGPHHAGPDQATAATTPMYVQVAFDSLLPLGDQIPTAILEEAVPGIPWGSVSGPEVAVEPSREAGIRILWGNSWLPGPDPTEPAPGTYPQSALTRVEANRYERSPDARRACIAHHGTSCAACGFSFEQKYGEIGADFIHVHHVVPASQLGSSYELDPISDLVPLCANCHAMAHQGVSTPRTVAELRRIIGDAGFLRGTTVSPGELEAQREARRILEQQ